MALRTELVDSFNHERVADDAIDTAGWPAAADFFTGMVPVVVEHQPDDSDDRLRSPGFRHGRSYELAGSNDPESGPQQIWSDRFGNNFTTLSSKGNNFSQAEMGKDDAAPSGWRFYGLQDGDALLRQHRASLCLRAAGVDTEWPLRVLQPKLLRYGGEYVDQTEYKRLLGARLLQGEMNEHRTQAESVQSLQSRLDAAHKTVEAINSKDFFVTLRATATGVRAWDLIDQERVQWSKLAHTFRTYNRLAPLRWKELSELALPASMQEEWDFNDPSTNPDIVAYFSEVLPKLIGLNLARMHDVGLIHKYLHMGNITVLGGIVDLDSVEGVALDLGDTESTQEAYVEDLEMLFRSGDELLDNPALQVVVSDVERAAFNRTLFETYIKMRKFKDPAREPADIYKRLFHRAVGEDDEMELGYHSIYDVSYDAVGAPVTQALDAWLYETRNQRFEEMARAVYEKYIQGSEEMICGDIIYEKLHGLSPEQLPAFEDMERGLYEWFFTGSPAKGDDITLVPADVRESGVLHPVISKVFAEAQESAKRVLAADTAPMPDFLKGLDQDELQTLAYGHNLRHIAFNGLKLLQPSKAEFWKLMTSMFRKNYLEKHWPPSPEKTRV